MKGQTKRCFKCGEVKPVSEFYRHAMMADGHLGKCKSCTKRDVRENRRSKLAWYQHRQSIRSKLPEVKARGLIYQRRLRKRFPEKFSARRRVAYAIRTGKIRRMPCEMCGSTLTHAHHEDYSKPLEIRWLCSDCHWEVHLAHRRSQ